MTRDPRYSLLTHILIERRLQAQLTQQELAEKLKKPQSFVSKYESGERRLDCIELITICESIGIDATIIMKEITSYVT